MSADKEKDVVGEDLKTLLKSFHEHLSSEDNKSFSQEQKIKLLRVIKVFDDVLTDENLKAISVAVRTFQVLRSLGVAGSFISGVFKTLAIIFAGYVAVKTGAVEAVKAALSN